MLLPRRTNALVVLLLLLLAATLVLLATLQYRWIDRVSDAERQQMRANIDFGARRFVDDFSRELVQIHESFVHEGDAAEQWRQWRRAVPNPELIEAVYLIERTEDDWTLRPAGNSAGVVPWPAALEPIHQRLPRIGPGQPRRGPPDLPQPFFGGIPALYVVEARGGGGMPEGPPRMFGRPGPPRMVLVRLDREALRDAVLPRLAQRHFSTSRADEYDVAVTGGDEVLYRSNRAWPDGHTPPDIALPIAPFGVGPRRRSPDFERLRREPPPPRPDAWRILVRRHDGSVDAVVASARRRNLAVSFGIVLILGAAVLLLAALLRRAERLRKQQLEFVAAISHELNTPVAALRSAGENLRDGIIHDPAKLARYGETIVRESTRLGELTSQVLELAGMQERRGRAAREPVDVAAVIADAIAQCGWLVEGTPVRIESHVDAGLPPLQGDARAITRAVQNLVANAIRHGGAGEWVGVRATRDGDRVAITVEDRGPGIEPAEAAQLFDAFYRGRNSSAVPGAGLGLAIVRQIAAAHGGSVRIDKRKGGASLTIEFPVADHA
jgi:signal transduction histidine kinase